MSSPFLRHIVLLLLSLSPIWALATHNRGGEITYTHISGLTYEFTITTCTDVGPSAQADRDELYIDYGDGQGDTLARINSLTQGMPMDHQKNVYKGIHTFTSPGTYVICMEDPNRNEGILNIYPGTGGSDNVVFSLQTQLIIDPFSGNSGANNSVAFDDCPCPALACVNEQYCYNALAYDPDGDSLSYELVAPFGSNCSPLPMPTVYQFPHQVAGGTMTVDPVSGTMCWDAPAMVGEFNFTLKITEWRNGHEVGYVIRDIQLTVMSNCSNDAPEIDPLPDTCVIAGNTIQFNVHAEDDNANQGIELSASGLPFNVISPANFPTVSGTGSVNGTFTWSTTCDHIKPGPYQVLFGVTDNGNPSFSDYESMLISVIPPKVTGVTANAFGNGVNINWNATGCANAEGYRIYRTSNPSFNLPDCCSNPDPEDHGFTQVGEVFGVSTTSYTDVTSLTLGIDYCYLVTAFYNVGQVESCPSDTSCARLQKEVPVISHVTVVQTDATNGIDSVMWSKPTELDTNQYPGPYSYKIYHGTSINSVNTLIGQTTSSTFLGTSDTTFTHFGIDTENQPNYYRVELFFTNSGTEELVGTSNEAGSVYITTTPNDNEITISWNETVPWINTDYEVYRATNFAGPYTYVGTTTQQEYTDTGLVNGVQYCYFVKSIGYYSSPSIISPLENLSQRTCDSPVDLTPPCPPVLSIDGDCAIGENLLTWTNPNNFCADDVMSYNLYFTPVEGTPMELIATFDNNGDTTYVHNYDGSVAGCYVITAIDSVQYSNESDSSNVVCFDNCPSYWLPNVFTPNGDGSNDFFIPLNPYKYVESIQIEIYNRWGQVVFETTDPDINWDGIHKDAGTMVPDGVYYYLCTVNTIRLTGIEPIVLKGFVHKFSQNGGPANQ